MRDRRRRIVGQPNSVVAFDPTSGEHVASVDVGRDPLVTVGVAGRIWSLDVGDRALSVIDPNDLGPIAIAEAAGRVWVSVE
jgi:hypothetical protein